MPYRGYLPYTRFLNIYYLPPWSVLPKSRIRLYGLYMPSRHIFCGGGRGNMYTVSCGNI